jgi:hypothetical protein
MLVCAICNFVRSFFVNGIEYSAYSEITNAGNQTLFHLSFRSKFPTSIFKDYHYCWLRLILFRVCHGTCFPPVEMYPSDSC